MQRAAHALVALLGVVLVGACAKSKSDETPAAPKPVTEAGVAPASAGKALLCSDGLHRRGDHWKVECNVCRCGADGAILCSEFPCAARILPSDGSAPPANDH